jgi:transcriptional regulator of arginine metabolism
MKNKTQRLLAIRKIIVSNKIGTQDELMQKLQDEGFSYTQATLSRDLKFLKVGKVADPEKGYIYFISEGSSLKEVRVPSSDNFPVNGFLSIKFSNNLAVIRTLPGYAGSIASLIDSRDLYQILGTIAGDDTILLILVEGITRQDVINAMILIMPELKGKI